MDKIIKCFMPNCTNTNENKSKVFIPVPFNPNIRKLWWQSAGYASNTLHIKSSNLYCCEEHFKIHEDFENWEYAKFLGKKPVVKKGILPKQYKENVKTRSPNPSPKNTLKRLNEEFDDERTSFKKINTPPTITDSLPSTSKIEIISLSSSSRVSASPLEDPIPSEVGSSESISSSQNSSQDSSFLCSLPSTSSEFAETSGARLQTTLNAIRQHPRFYLGLPPEVYGLVQLMCETTKLNHRDILITLQKIRTDDTYFRLSVDFELSVSQVQKIFVKCVPIIADYMKNFIFWPQAIKIQETLPSAFRARYAKVQSIIDCFEVQIEKPSHPVHQSNTWSDYKQCNTLKFLISCTPNGFINFISQAYPGRASDKNIVQKSGYLDKVPYDSHVMADRGFKHIQNMLLQKNCTLIRPASVNANEQSSKEDVKESKQIASTRIHIERIIRRVREFHILSPHACTNHKLVHLMSYFAVIACGIINFQEGILR